MAGEVKSYNPSKVIIIVGGVPIKGYADGTFINITAQSDAVTSQAGADGEIARAVSADKRKRVTITLQHTSDSNAVLNGFANADSVSGAGIMFPLYMQDLLGSDKFVVAQAWVQKKPDREFGKDISNRTWVIDTGEPSIDLI
jgi:hypothetical protein